MPNNESGASQGASLDELLRETVINVEQLRVLTPDSDTGPQGHVYQLLATPASLPGKVPTLFPMPEDAFLTDQFLQEAAKRVEAGNAEVHSDPSQLQSVK